MVQRWSVSTAAIAGVPARHFRRAGLGRGSSEVELDLGDEARLGGVVPHLPVLCPLTMRASVRRHRLDFGLRARRVHGIGPCQISPWSHLPGSERTTQGSPSGFRPLGGRAPASFGLTSSASAGWERGPAPDPVLPPGPDPVGQPPDGPGELPGLLARARRGDDRRGPADGLRVPGPGHRRPDPPRLIRPVPAPSRSRQFPRPARRAD
jgi:hypothetical protein